MIEIVLMSLAGGLGAACRMIVDGALRRALQRAGRDDGLPWATIAINVSGSLLLGCLAGWSTTLESHIWLSMIGGTGFCGGFTTFSTQAYESVQLLRAGRLGAAAANTALTLVVCVAAAALGLFLTGSWL